MNETTQTEDRFLQWLDSLIESAERSHEDKANQGEHFEAVLDRIRGNVASVYGLPQTRGVRRGDE